MTSTDLTSTREKIDWANALATASLLPREYQRQPANLMLAAEYADELGIGRMAALTDIHVINGKPSLSADLMQGLVRKAGHRLRVRFDEATMTATAELIRSDDQDYTFTVVWNPDKAKRAGLWGNRGPWTQYPAAMLKARAISEVIREGASEVLHGALYLPEELGAVVDAEGKPTERPQPAPEYTDQRVGFVARWLAANGHEGDDPAAVLAAAPEEEAHDPKRLTSWLASVYESELANAADAADEVVQGELIEEVTDGE